MFQIRAETDRPAAPPSNEMRAEADRLLGSATFSRSPRLRAFLAYVVECAAEGRAQEINEYSLGVQVFGKPADYAPHEDNIVRVTARQLRVKLEEYYHGEGRRYVWRLEVPKGGYVPELRRNEEPGKVETAIRKPFWGRWVVAGVLGVGGWAMAAMLWYSAGAVPAEPAYLLEGIFAGEPGQVMFIMDDPLLPVSHRQRDSLPSLDEFLNGYYRDPLSYSPERRQHLHDLIARNEFVRPHTIRFLLRLSRIAASRGIQVWPMHCREVTPGLLGQGSLVLTGGIGSNPWVAAFQEHLAFEHRIDPMAGRRYFVNRSPREGEEPVYVSVGGETSEQRLYTRIAVMPNPYGHGKVALLGGTSRQSTEGAWHFAVSQQGVDEITRQCGQPPARLAQFEAILETTVLGTTPMDWKIQAVRCGPPQ